MAYQHIRIPEGGEKITIKDGKLHVPEQPIVGYVEGDGIDITRAPRCGSGMRRSKKPTPGIADPLVRNFPG